MANYLHKAAIGTELREKQDAADRKRRIAMRNRKPCECKSGRLAWPPSNKCIACNPLTKPAWDAWLAKESAS